jgi:virginiamycin B lyase
VKVPRRGAITEFTLPGPGEVPTAITTRSDGSVWFASTESAGIARVGTISAGGKITEVVSILQSSTITGFVGGPDGNLWLTVTSTTYGDSVDRLATAGRGTFTRYALPDPSASPQGITVGSDNNLWFTEAGANAIGRMTTTGLKLPTIALPAGAEPEQIVAGPGNTVWFTQAGTDQIGELTTSGVLTELAVPTSGAQPFGIAAGPNGTLWFTERSGNRIGYVTV